MYESSRENIIMAHDSLIDRSTAPAAKRKRLRALRFWLYTIAVFLVALAVFDMIGR